MKYLLKHFQCLPLLSLSLSLARVAAAHDLATGASHPHYDWSVQPPEVVRAPEWFLAQTTTTQAPRATNTAPSSSGASTPASAKAFLPFSDKLKLRWDERYLYVESNGLPAHNMMVGITAWQQQVPLPQNYTGTNAWQIPLTPVVSKSPASIKGRFLRGAIALAANGIPIFNPQNNRGEVSAEIGELDQWGGHCGRADDYHYHAAPLHLQSVVGKGQPIAYALDGYPIYGLTEPDATPPTGLDTFNGHTTAALGYHYHGSTKYPYVNGGFHGEVVEREGQVDPQPRANPVREALPGLRGAKITAFESTGANSYKLSYDLNGEKRAILYAINSDGTFPFEFQNGREGTVKQVYTQRGGGGGGPGGPRRGGGGPPAPGEDRQRGARAPEEATPPPRTDLAAASSLISKPSSSFVLTSPVVANGGALPTEFTGDGDGVTPPIAWTGAPAGTKNYALIMHHLDPEGKTKWYWTLYDIPANVTHLEKNSKGIGTLGTGFKGQVGYEPPHSQGPGAKTYVITLYALSSAPQITVPASQVSADVLSAAIKDRVLASADLSVVHTRGAASGGRDQAERRPRGAVDQEPPPRPRRDNVTPPAAELPSVPLAQQAPPPTDAQGEPRRGGGPGGKGGGGKGGPDNKGLIKPTMADTMKVNVYADNWFVLFINGKLRAVDSIEFTPHNVITVDILPEYPMTIAIMAKDNADPKTGMEYGDHVGDGGFIIKFADGTVSNATWKAKNFFKGPLNHDTKNPVVEHTPIPDQWWTIDFDDSTWPNATEYTEERVNPKEPYYQADFAGAKFIWSDDLDLDNTVIFRTRVDKPGWKPRWNTKPDLDITGAPFK